MYIQKVAIDYIRSIGHFEMTFEEPAGWHVLIGDNGAGKSSVVRAIAFALIGEAQAKALRQSPNAWLSRGAAEGIIRLTLSWDERLDQIVRTPDEPDLKVLELETKFIRRAEKTYFDSLLQENIPDGIYIFFHSNVAKIGAEGWFSTGFGPFRRFSGGNTEQEKLFESHPRLGAHLSLFGEDVSLVSALEWVKSLDYLRLKEKERDSHEQENTIAYNSLIKLINESHFLPHGVQIEDIDAEGIIFIDGNQNRITTLELSDGYRSILSLTFELIRQLVRVYSAKKVFENIEKGKMQITLPGVVLIDEIDTHLHPSWQTRIGEWFKKYFPNIQFIVTTHSPLICRACDRGSIWRLAAPGSQMPSGEILGIDKERLIYGNILDAYGTEVFGPAAVRSQQSNQRKERLGKLNILAALGKLSDADEKERQHLQKVLSTDAPTGF